MKMRRARPGILLALSAIIVIAAVLVILRAAQANALKREYTALTAESAPGGGAQGIVPAVDISQVKAAYIESPLSAVKIKYYHFNLHDPDEKNIVAAVLKLIYSNQDSAVKGDISIVSSAGGLLGSILVLELKNGQTFTAQKENAFYDHSGDHIVIYGSIAGRVPVIENSPAAAGFLNNGWLKIDRYLSKKNN